VSPIEVESPSASGLHPVPSPRDPVLGGLLQRCTFELGDPAERTDLDVAVSGGPDSTALLALSLATGARVTAHHVDHGLRSASGSEAGFVQRLCGRWGAGFAAHRVVVPDGPDLERRCREARLGVLPSGCLTGHTADDQAFRDRLGLRSPWCTAGVGSDERLRAVHPEPGALGAAPVDE
jgi:hypothetical protein